MARYGARLAMRGFDRWIRVRGKSEEEAAGTHVVRRGLRRDEVREQLGGLRD